MELLVLAGIALVIVFPLYTLVRLSTMGSDIEELKRRVARLQGRFPVAGPVAQSPDTGVNPELRSAQPPAQPLYPPDFMLGPVGAPPVTAMPLEPTESGRTYVAPVSRTAPGVHLRSQSTPAETSDIESLLGANWMSKLGIAAIAISVAYFLQYAFRSGWIRPSGQVGIGLCGAVLMMGGGQILLTKERFRAYGQVLFSGGIVVYFLSIYAAYHFYSPPLMGYWPAFIAFAVGAIAASALSLANKTEIVAGICLLGAFAAPALIRDHGGPPSPDGLTRLYVYLLVVNLWAAAFVRLRGWRSIAIVSFMCTWLLFLGAGPIAHGGWRTETFAILFFLSAVWAGISAARDRFGASDPGSLQLVGSGLIVAACLAFVFASWFILAALETFGVPDIAVVGTMIGALLAGLSAMPQQMDKDDGMRKGLASLSALAMGGVMLLAFASAPAVPAAMVGFAFGFAVLHYALFLGAGFALRNREGGEEPAALMFAVNAAAHILAILHVLAHVNIAGVPAACIWLPLVGYVMTGAVWLATRDDDRPMLSPAMLAVSAQAFLLAALMRAVDSANATFVSHWPLIATCLLAAEFVLLSSAWVAIRRRIAWPAFRMDVAGTLGNAVLFFCLFAWALGGHKTGGISPLAVCAVGMAVWHAGMGAIALAQDDDPLPRCTYLGLAVGFLTIAIPLQVEAAWITIAWAAEAAAVVWAGAAAKSRAMRMFGVAVLALAASRALFIDVVPDAVPFDFLFNRRTLAGATLIAAAYLAAWLVWKDRDDEDEVEKAIAGGLIVAANACTLAFVSRDLWQQFANAQTGLVSAPQLALSMFWAAYGLAAICVGIWSRQRMVRLFSMGLLYVSIFKVFLYDLRNLETPYRIASFFTLGVIFLLVSYLYTRFEERIRAAGDDNVPGAPPRASAPPAPGAAT
jgi:uncharacterized membrane protein